jgi:hypothetical protein
MKDNPCIDCLKLPICINRGINLSTSYCLELYDYIYEEETLEEKSEYQPENQILMSFSVIKHRVNRDHRKSIRKYYESFKNSK